MGPWGAVSSCSWRRAFRCSSYSGAWYRWGDSCRFKTGSPTTILPSTSQFWALLNAGGLPPLTGFVIKLKGLLRLPARLGGCLLAARGVALCSYSRFLVNGRFKSLQVTPSLIGGSALGVV